MTKIQRLSLGLQNANNLRINRGFGENRELYEAIAAEAAHLEGHLLRYIDACKNASSDKNLSAAGRQAKIAELRDGVVEVLQRADKAGQMDAMITSMRGDLSKRAEKQREKNRSGDSVLNYLRASEVRRHLFDLRERARVEHDARLAKENPALMSDQDRVFVDPIEALFTEACSNYDATKEAFLLAVEQPPFPMQVLDPAIVQRGLSALERAVTPELASAIDMQVVKRSMYSELMGQVGDIVERPLAQAVLSEKRTLVVNGGQQ